MSQALVDLCLDELQEVEKIVGKPCKLEITTSGSLGYTGYKIVAEIKTNLPQQADRFVTNHTVCTFNLTQFPGNCGILVTHETYTSADYRRKGMSVFIQRMKEKIARTQKYSVMLATTIPSNNNDKALERAGFKKLPDVCFTNRRTREPITTWIKNLYETSP